VKRSDSKSALALNGGKRSVRSKIRPANPIGMRELIAACSVLRSGILSKFVGEWNEDFFGGPRVREFEAKCENYFGVKHAITVNSWTSGLICAVGALDIEPGDEIIVPTWTMSATAMAVIHWCAIPIFADINLETYCMDPIDVERRITSKTKAIIAVDIFGNSAAMNEILYLADKYSLKVISDSAQSPGAKYRNKYVGTLADIGGISLNYHKHIHTGEGGVLFTNSDDLALRMRLIRNHGESVVVGMDYKEINNIIGFNFRMGEIEAAIGKHQLGRLETIVQRKRHLANRLICGIKDLPGIIVPEIDSDVRHVYYVIPIRLDIEVVKADRTYILDALEAEGVPGIERGYKLVHMLPMFQKCIAYGNRHFPFNMSKLESLTSYLPGACPVAEKLHYETFFSIALTSFEFSERNIDEIILSFRKVWQSFEQS